jgi:uncharacterized protein with beta-barrel porin domain
MGGTASIGTLTNQTGQSIAGLASGILMGNGATITNLTNNGYITGTAASTASPTTDGVISNGLTLFSGASLGNLVNTGSISGGQYGISNQGNITSLQNSGTISSTSDAAGSGINNINGGTISTLNNTGVISGLGRGITNNGAASVIGAISNGGNITGYYGIVNQFATINSISNTGTIGANGTSASQAIYNIAGTIGNITNAGSIHSIGIDSVGTSASYAIFNAGTINTITNTATVGTSTSGIFGASNVDINNTGKITTLNNAQNNLVIQGNLPINYNIIIRGPSSYGGLTYYSLGTSTQTNFGISPISTAFTPGTTTYAGVLTGLTSANLTATAGTYGGAFVTTQWQLVASSNQFNLITNTPAATAAIISNTSAGQNLSNSIATSYNSIVSGQKPNFLVALTPAAAAAATAASASNTPVTQATFTSIVPQITGAQAQQLEQVHAEGYSSNMTIGLEQMAHITNTVMDRIHAPMSASPSTKVYQDDEGRYIWADAAAVKGAVNNYNNLAGFGYNLYDVIFGGDIKRSKDGGFGVFAGTGTTSMTESQQVTQNFNTTNFYAGLYGARNFDAQVKLSGAVGYMYGSTSANRSMPDVGPIAGSNATSSYKTNGLYGAAKLAKAYQAESFTISPFIGASYSQLWMGGTSEQGGNSIFNYAISGSTAYTAVTFAGADFIYPLLKGTNDPLSLIGFYKLGYDWYANSNSAHSITATGPTGSFTQVGANMGPVSNMVGLGIQGGITKEISARIGAVASYNTYGHEYGGGAELRFKF